MGHQAKGPIHFGPFEVTSQVFLTTPHTFALVNLKPLLPGHVLVCPLKPHKRLTDLSPPELTDLFRSVQRVQHMLARHFFVSTPPVSPQDQTVCQDLVSSRHSESSRTAKTQDQAGTPAAGSFNIAIQDGVEAGQTVPHLHVHVIPRIRAVTQKPDDGSSVDELYVKMAGEEGNVGGALWDRDDGGGRGEHVEQVVSEIKGRPRPGGGFPAIEDAERMARSEEDMHAEAEVWRGVLRVIEAVEKEG